MTSDKGVHLPDDCFDVVVDEDATAGDVLPVLARLLRARLESYVPAAYGRLAELVQSFREKVKQRFSSVEHGASSGKTSCRVKSRSCCLPAATKAHVTCWKEHWTPVGKNRTL